MQNKYCFKSIFKNLRDTFSNNSTLKDNFPILLSAFFFGTLYSIYLMGEQIIPTNSDWLFFGDAAQHQIGWLNFRQDNWHWPLTFTDNLAYPTGVSIGYTDSIPILAIIFKLFSNLLPDNFQYFGICVLMNFIFQFFWGAKLALLFTPNNYFCAISSGLLFMLAPPLTWRIHGHFALTSHWLILAAIWSYFKLNISGNLKSVFLLQVIIIVIASGIHPYIAVISLSIILVSYLGQLACAKIKPIQAFTIISIITLLLITSWYLFGYLPNPSSSTNNNNGYGLYSLNLVSIFDSSSYSSFLPSLPIHEGQYEGFNYLGLGILVLLLTNTIVITINKPNLFKTGFFFLKSHSILFLLLFILMIFALSNQIYWQNTLVFEYPLPISMTKIAAAFRASGRFFWPIHYLILLGTLLTTFKIYPRPYLKIILILIISLQFLDLIPLQDSSSNWIKSNYSDFGNAQLMQENRSHILPSQEWSQLYKHHNKIIILPSHQCGKSPDLWPWFEKLAAVQGLKTNSAYLPRLSSSQIQTHCVELPQMVSSGKLEQDAAYVLDKKKFLTVYTNINNDSENSHYCSEIDTFILCRKRLSPKDKGMIKLKTFPYIIGTKLDFSNPVQTLKYQFGDWSKAEPIGTWTDGSEASLLMDINIPLQENLLLSVQVIPFVKFIPFTYVQHRKQVVDILVNRQKITQWIFQPGQPQLSIREALISAKLINQKTPLQITFKFLNPISPQSVGLSDDLRQLGLFFKTFQLSKF